MWSKIFTTVIVIFFIAGLCWVPPVLLAIKGYVIPAAIITLLIPISFTTWVWEAEKELRRQIITTWDR